MLEAALRVLRCPRTHQPLALRSAAGATWLVTADDAWAYPVIDGMPTLVPEGARPWRDITTSVAPPASPPRATTPPAPPLTPRP